MYHLGNFYITDRGNHCVRKVTVSTGIITTIAGTGTDSYSGDNGPATSATFNNPIGVSLDSAGTHSLINSISLCISQLFLLYLGNVYIGDEYNHRIRKVTVSTGIVTTVVGTGTPSYSGDGGAATAATLSYPVGVALDISGTHHSLLLTQSMSLT